jgi:hypothetical protein
MFSPTAGSGALTTNAPSSDNLTLPASSEFFIVQSSSESLNDRTHCLLRHVLIRLNNAAVDLLQRHQKHRLCIDTLKDGLTLMKKSSCDVSASMTTSVEEAWARAKTRQFEALADPTLLGSPSPLDVSNEASVVVLSSRHDPKEAHYILAAHRTSKVCLTLDPSDLALDLAMVRLIFIYNYGVAHRCCAAIAAAGTIVPRPSANNGEFGSKLESFCFQIFQYAETLLPPKVSNESEEKNHLLFRLVLTRNLLTLSCRLGLLLCEHYKATLDRVMVDIYDHS